MEFLRKFKALYEEGCKTLLGLFVQVFAYILLFPALWFRYYNTIVGIILLICVAAVSFSAAFIPKLKLRKNYFATAMVEGTKYLFGKTKLKVFVSSLFIVSFRSYALYESSL